MLGWRTKPEQKGRIHVNLSFSNSSLCLEEKHLLHLICYKNVDLVTVLLRIGKLLSPGNSKCKHKYRVKDGGKMPQNEVASCSERLADLL